MRILGLLLLIIFSTDQHVFAQERENATGETSSIIGSSQTSAVVGAAPDNVMDAGDFNLVLSIMRLEPGETGDPHPKWLIQHWSKLYNLCQTVDWLAPKSPLFGLKADKQKSALLRQVDFLGNVGEVIKYRADRTKTREAYQEVESLYEQLLALVERAATAAGTSASTAASQAGMNEAAQAVAYKEAYDRQYKDKGVNTGVNRARAYLVAAKIDGAESVKGPVNYEPVFEYVKRLEREQLSTSVFWVWRRLLFASKAPSPEDELEGRVRVNLKGSPNAAYWRVYLDKLDEFLRHLSEAVKTNLRALAKSERASLGT